MLTVKVMHVCVYSLHWFRMLGNVIYCNCSWFNMHLLHFNDFEMCVHWNRLGEKISKFLARRLCHYVHPNLTHSLSFSPSFSLFASFKTTKLLSSWNICMFGLFVANIILGSFCVCAHFCRFVCLPFLVSFRLNCTYISNHSKWQVWHFSAFFSYPQKTQK